MIALPRTAAVPVVLTFFGDDALWERLKAEIVSPTEEGFLASVEFVDDRRFEGMGEDDVRRGTGGDFPDGYPHPVVFVVDAVTAGAPDLPILVVEPRAEPEPSFRATPRQVQAIENNLSIANMDFEEFTSAVDDDGVFRGFSD